MSDQYGAIGYFRDMVTTDRRAAELEAFEGKVIGTYCNFVPEELIYALGAVPVRLCSGDDDASRRGEDLFPRDTCALVKSCIGCAIRGDGFFPSLDLLVIPTPCDAKKKLGAVLEAFKPVHILQLPPSKTTPAALNFWLDQVWELVAKLEECTGKRLTRASLQTAVEMLNRRQQVFRRFLELRKQNPPAVTGEEALFVTNSSFHDDPERWTRQLELLCTERESRGQGSSNISRLLLTGAPLIYPNFKLMRIIEAANAVVAMDETCSGTQRLYQPLVTRDPSLKAMVQAVAEKYLLPTTCPCFIEHSDHLKRIVEFVDEFKIDGVIYHCLRICPLFDIEANTVQRNLKKLGIPCLTLSTDYSREDGEQIRNRVQAFLEIIGGRVTSESRSG